jgi:hypothetical protein
MDAQYFDFGVASEETKGNKSFVLDNPLVGPADGFMDVE